jgi:hypothetical protein
MYPVKLEKGLAMATLSDIQVLVKRIDGLAKELGIYEGGEWTTDSPVTGKGTFIERGPIPTHLADSVYRFPHAVLQQGSPTYGQAWRLNATGGTHYGTGEYDPFRLGSGFLGVTKVEAYRALCGLVAGLELAKAERD